MKEERQQCRPHEKESLSIVESDRGEKYQYTRVRERRGVICTTFKGSLFHLIVGRGTPIVRMLVPTTRALLRAMIFYRDNHQIERLGKDNHHIERLGIELVSAFQRDPYTTHQDQPIQVGVWV